MNEKLENKVKYFFKSPYRGREDVRASLRTLQQFGRLVLVGGMLRDLSLFGNAGFRSDLDFVIVPYDIEAFEKHMITSGATTNRFGGYGLLSHRWQIDVWPLQKSWAHVHGHVKLSTVNDLRRATFFNCDAIVYDVESSSIRASKSYFDDLEAKVLEINLEPNPNPSGSSVRAFRYALTKGFSWGPKLSRYVAETIDAVGWDLLLEGEVRSFGTRYLDTLDRNAFNRELLKFVDHGTDDLFDPGAYKKNAQPWLPHIF
ncbi:MAG: hypothetical protein ABJO29_15575 [Yoonia sp.]|uniref:hypothetical protein n=1 Tax=Yoonia sp. TaxID=2212373 RepID=UPI003283B35B